ncbi:hypothetical protein JCM10908_003170 [Rhodotorula pacifica]|uniref:PLAC8 family protein n=1 Tax=Rhodotorula pacifica TaxID=1495444 RepID=UPI0031773BF7
MAQDDKKDYQLLATEEAAPPPAYEAASASTVGSDLVDTRSAVHRVQPTAVRQMAIGGARNSKSQEIGLDGLREWNHQLCSCHETPGLTAAACLCPCMVFSANRSKLTHLSATGQPIPAPQHVGLWCGLYALAPQLAGIGQAALQCVSRFQTRQRYGIRGNFVEDVLVGAFCTTCSLVQEARELDDEEEALREDGSPPETFYHDEENAPVHDEESQVASA